jgi:alkylation response protein AidB-like acyl-CoA dehydrogenase
VSLEPNEEQRLLADMVARFLADHAPPEGPGHTSMPADQWRALGDLGVLSLAVPESAGGLGGGPMEVALIGEALGRAAAMTPMADVAVLSALLLADSLPSETAAAWLAGIVSGEAIAAYSEAGHGQGEVAVLAAEDGWTLQGERRLVRHGDQAGAFILDTGAAGPGLLLLDAAVTGLTVTPYRLADGEMAARLQFEGVNVATSARLTASPCARRRSVALSALAVIGEMVGLMQTLYEATIDYVRERKQFGVAIGSFQVVQHRCARLFILIEQSRSMMLRAVHAADEAFEQRVLEARAYIADAALRLAQDATQLHGGMGVTDELLVGRGHRRLLVLSHLYGGAIGAREALLA